MSMITKGTKLRITDSRKGEYDGKAIKDFDPCKEEWYPIVVDQDLVVGLQTDWVKGENIPCRASLCSIRIRETAK